MSLSKKAKRIFGLLVLVYCCSFVWLNWNIDQARGGKPIIYSDGIGHYDYLPRLFLHHHLQYNQQDHAFASAGENGTYVNRFYCGTAVLQAPFFLAGALYARLFDYPVDGYSPPFQYAIGLSAVFYSLCGLYLLLVILVRFLSISETNALWTLAFTALGTNLLFYTVWFGTFSHAFSFFAMLFFVYCLCRAIEKSTRFNFFMLGLVFGLVVIIRPVNGLVLLLVPAFFPGKKAFLDFCSSVFRFKPLLLLLAGCLLPLMVQSAAWYLQTGKMMEWSYRQEGFYFLHPHITEVLFGFRRGLFIYCPLLLLCLVGVVAGWKYQRWRTAWITVFLLVFTYVTASWWHWTYGDTFGLRPFNDVLVAFMVLFAFVLVYWARAKKLMLTLAILFSALQLIFAWQFAAGITNISTMTADKFFHLFLKTSKHYVQLYGGADDIPPYAPHGMKTLHTFTHHFDQEPGGVLHVKGNEFIAGTEFVFPVSEKNTRHIWLELSFRKKLLRPSGMKDVLFVFHAIDTHRDSTRSYEALRLKEYPTGPVNEWTTTHCRVWLPDAVDERNLVKAYIWNRGQEEFYLDDYLITIQVPRW